MNSGVRLRVEGLMSERLLERALAEGAVFSNVRRIGAHGMIVETDARSAARLEALCRRFSISCRPLERFGFALAREKLKKRLSLLAAPLVCAAVLVLFFGRIWIVDVETPGGESADFRPLYDALRALDIHPGAAKIRVDPDLLQAQLAAASTEFSFVGVRLQGVRLLVQAVPAAPPPSLYDRSADQDLIARCDGVVQSVRVQSGAACVSPGDTVIGGQVLIRGQERISREETRPIRALGAVTARTWQEGFASLPLRRAEISPTGRRSVSSSLRILKWEWPLVQGETYASQQTEVQHLPIGGLFFPMEIRRTAASEIQTRFVPEDEALLRRRLSALAFADADIQWMQSHPNGAKIARRWIEYTPHGDYLTARAIYETHADIAVYADALNQQGG